VELECAGLKGGLESSDELTAEDTAEHLDGKEEGSARGRSGTPRTCLMTAEMQRPIALSVTASAALASCQWEIWYASASLRTPTRFRAVF